MPIGTREQAERRDAISRLLESGPVATQQTLVKALRARGLVATQSSVSRDLKDLGAIKTPQGYALPNGPSDNEPARLELARVAEFLREIRAAGPHLLVIRTAIGAAQRVALALDRSNWPEMVGNIGGDDTVFVATDSANHQKILFAKIDSAINDAANDAANNAATRQSSRSPA